MIFKIKLQYKKLGATVARPYSFGKSLKWALKKKKDSCDADTVLCYIPEQTIMLIGSQQAML